MNMAKKRSQKNEFPAGWDEPKARKVLEHYESQTAEEAAAEDDAAFKRPSRTLMKIPRKLVPMVRKLIAESEK